MKYTDEIAGFSGFDGTVAEEFSELVKLVKDIVGVYRGGDDTTKGYILKGGLVKLEIDEQKRLKVHEKEPFSWLSSYNLSIGIPNRNRTCA